jgi:hypothetical protein
VQRTEGLYGPFIVTERYNDNTQVNINDKIEKYDGEFIVMLQEWLQKDSNSIFHTVGWENSKFFYGYTNETNCFLPNRMDDGNIKLFQNLFLKLGSILPLLSTD